MVTESFLFCCKKSLSGDVVAGSGSCKQEEGNCGIFVQGKALVYVLMIAKHSRKVLVLFPVWVQYAGKSILQ